MILLFFVFVSYVFGHSVETLNIRRGLYTTVLAYDANHATSDISYMYSHINDDTLYVIAINKGVANQVICRETVTTPIIVSPRGCDNGNEKESVLRTNCGHKTIEGLTLNWMHQKNDDACLRLGSDATCLGPVYLYATQKPYDATLDNDWAIIPGAYLISGTGPSCAIPTITRVDIKLPKLAVQSTCENFPSGIYEVDTQSAQHGFFNFRLTTYSIEIKPYVAIRVYFLGNLVLDENKAVFDVDISAYNDTCIYLLTLIPAPIPFELNALNLPVPSNYFKNVVDINHRAMACNFGVSKKRFENNRPLWHGIPEGIPYGGRIVPRTPNGVPIEIKPNLEFADFDHDCARFYPAGHTFHGFGFTGFDGPVYNRYEPAKYTCYAPFPFPERVIDIQTIEERAKQCHMLGGLLATSTSDVCSMDSWKTYCRLGWIYFDNRCWYMPDPSRDALLKVPAGTDSEITCSSLHPSAISSYPVTAWVTAWLKRFFVFWKHPGTIVRIVITGNRCECYSSDEVTTCDCDDQIFPLCSYNVKSDFIAWTYTDYHPHTLEILRLGQSGLPHDGTQFTCECEPGWTGESCTKQTCVPPVLAASTLNESLANPQLVFFKKCYAKQRGFCVDDFVYDCNCANGYGPAANLLWNLYVDTPCTCPAFSNPSSTERLISINAVETPNKLAVCGFLQRGRCVTEGWNEARCHCRYRWAREGDRELAYTGKTCGCRTTHFTYGINTVTESICNNHGTCCPHGEREDGTEGECPLKFDGCYCDDGWAGEACTSPTPSTSLLTRPFVIGFDIFPNRVYARQETRLPVGFVYLKTSDTSPSVFLTDTISSDIIATCTLVRFESWETHESATHKFNCSETRANYVVGEAFPPAAVKIRVTSSIFGICGVHVNTKAARFYEMPEFSQVENSTAELCRFNIPPDLGLIRPPIYNLSGNPESVVFRLKNGPSPIFYIYVTNPSPWTVPQVRDVADGNTTGICSLSTYGVWETANPLVTKFECFGLVGRYIYLNAMQPSGVNIRVLGDDFQLCASQDNDLIDETQPFNVAKHGSTTGPCLCDPGFVGPTCNIGISAWRLSENDAEWTYRQCGDSTLPKRGEAADDVCVCNSIGDVFVFDGEACECAIVDGIMCAGHGTCERASFPEGRCSFDKNALHHDPLSTPFKRTNLGFSTFIAWNVSTFQTLDGTEWTFNVGQEFIMNNVFWHIAHCDNIDNVTLTVTPNNEPSSGDYTLPPGVYDVILQCVYALHTGSSGTVMSSGVVECSNPIYRLMDDSLSKLYAKPKYCEYPDFFHATGLGYGLFHNLTSGVDFTSTTWTLEHYRMVSSVIGNRKCDDFTLRDWNLIVEHLATTFITNEENSTGTQLIPDKITRTFFVSAPFDIHGLIAYSPSNKTCSLLANTIPAAGQFVSCYCEEGCNRIELLDANQNIDAITVNSWYRNTSYREVFRTLHDSILVSHIIPTPTLDTCASGALIDIYNTTDQEYLTQIYETKLSMRSCADNLDCQQFVPAATCEYDNVNTKHVPWLNGDELVDVSFGNEGGCECSTDTTGFFDHLTFCSSCLPGYGPDTPYEIRALQEMQLLVPNLVDGEIRRCSLPADATSTRPTTVCGGRGYIRRTSRTELVHIRAVRGTIKRCQAVNVEGYRYQLVDVDAVHADLQSFTNGTDWIHLIHHRAFLNGIEKTGRVTCQHFGSELEFVTRGSSDTLIGLKERNMFTLWI